VGKIIVLVKDILDFEEIKFWSSNISANYKGKKTKINDLDKNALQAALDLKDEHDFEVITLSVGDNLTKTALLEVLAMGADEAYLVNDESMRSADQYTISKVLQAAIEKMGNYDLIICGELSLDTMASQIGVRLATLLDIPLLPYVKELKIVGDTVEALKEYEDFDEKVRSPVPSIVSVIREINEPSIPSLIKIMRAKRKPLTEWTLQDLNIGEVKNRVNIIDLETPLVERRRVTIDGETEEEIVSKLIQYLKQEGVAGV